MTHSLNELEFNLIKSNSIMRVSKFDVISHFKEQFQVQKN